MFMMRGLDDYLIFTTAKAAAGRFEKVARTPATSRARVRNEGLANKVGAFMPLP
jgi:hypothetical protein